MYLRRLYPTPKTFSEDEAARFRFGPRVSARVSGLSEALAARVKAIWRQVFLRHL